MLPRHLCRARGKLVRSDRRKAMPNDEYGISRLLGACKVSLPTVDARRNDVAGGEYLAEFFVGEFLRVELRCEIVADTAAHPRRHGIAGGGHRILQFLLARVELALERDVFLVVDRRITDRRSPFSAVEKDSVERIVVF